MEDRERVELEGEREMQVECCVGTDNNIDEEEKEEKEAGDKKRKGEERIREEGEKDGGRGIARGWKEQASRKGERGEEERT